MEPGELNMERICKIQTNEWTGWHDNSKLLIYCASRRAIRRIWRTSGERRGVLQRFMALILVIYVQSTLGSGIMDLDTVHINCL
jgi:hypothetical protein